MAFNFQNIDTIIILMMENRSFDHLLGYLSLPPHNRNDIEGLKPDIKYQNVFQQNEYGTFKLDTQLLEDPPHERDTIALQLGAPHPPEVIFPMSGFVESYAQRKPQPKDLSLVMGYHTEIDVPMYHFFSQHYAICDHWFASLPTGTQPNRLMAMSGESEIDVNAKFLLPKQKLVYDWLNERHISWCSYNYGKFPFFSLMHAWQKTIVEDFAVPLLLRPRYFRRYENFKNDWQSHKDLPQVIFMEPEYTDILDHSPNDDHPPTGLDMGQAFIQSIYETLISNPARWQKTVMLITYDEHGGCFDHVSPLWMRTEPPEACSYQPFQSTGVRVPAFIISPFVEAGSVYCEPLDHTAILHFLAEKFDAHQSYSPVVDERQKNFGKISQALTRNIPRTDSPKPEKVFSVTKSQAAKPADLAPGANANTAAFQAAADIMKSEHPKLWPDFCLQKGKKTNAYAGSQSKD